MSGGTGRIAAFSNFLSYKLSASPYIFMRFNRNHLATRPIFRSTPECSVDNHLTIQHTRWTYLLLNLHNSHEGLAALRPSNRIILLINLAGYYQDHHKRTHGIFCRQSCMRLKQCKNSERNNAAIDIMSRLTLLPDVLDPGNSRCYGTTEGGDTIPMGLA